MNNGISQNCFTYVSLARFNKITKYTKSILKENNSIPVGATGTKNNRRNSLYINELRRFCFWGLFHLSCALDGFKKADVR